MQRPGWTLLAILLMTACAREAPPPAGAADSAIVVDSAITTFVIEGEGLRFFVLATGAARPLPFGTDSAVVHEALLRTPAGVPVESGRGGDCPGSYARWSNGLSLRYAAGRFIGWSVAAGDGTVTTAGGIGVGSTRAQLEDVMTLEVIATSLGTEFTAGGIAGLLDGTGPAARVSNLWAGEVCIAR